MMADPSGGLTNAMVYTLPFIVLAPNGDVQLNESAVAVVPSDLLRFFRPTGVTTSYLIFYSDQDGGIDAGADTGMPSPATNLVQLSEVALAGGGFGAVYTTTTGSPGMADFAVQYTFISDAAVPEPSTAALGAIGCSLLALAVRRRRQRPSAA
jgi:hypothetical protein